MKRMSSLEYHLGIKLRFYPSDRQKKIIKQNYDAQRFVYNQYVGADCLIYHTKNVSKIAQLNSTMPFVMRSMTKYEIDKAKESIEAQELTVKPKNIRDKYCFLRAKNIDSLAIATPFRIITKLGETTIKSVMEFLLFIKNAAIGRIKPTVSISDKMKHILIMVRFDLLILSILGYQSLESLELLASAP